MGRRRRLAPARRAERGDPASARRELRRVAALRRRRSPNSGRPCSSSRTSTGPTTSCSTSWTSSSIWVEHVPLLVVATARPELFERQAGLGRRQARTRSPSRSRRSTTATRHGCSRRCSTRQRAPGRSSSRSCSLAQAATRFTREQFARMFAERGDVGRRRCPRPSRGSSRRGLDSLPPDEKELLLDAAVLGKTFWRGALGGDDVEPRLRSLQREEFIRARAAQRGRARERVRVRAPAHP